MEFLYLLTRILLVAAIFGAIVAKVAFETGIAPLVVAYHLTYLAGLSASFALSLYFMYSDWQHRAQGKLLLEACRAETEEQRKALEAKLEERNCDHMKRVAALQQQIRILESRQTDLSTLNKASQQEVTSLRGMLRQANVQPFESRRVENAKTIERQWYLLQDIMVEGGIHATTEHEWVCAIRKLIQRKPAPSTPTGVVSADLEKAREELAKETAAKVKAESKLILLDAQAVIASTTMRIQKLDLEDLEAENGRKQRIIDDLSEQLHAARQNDSKGCHEKLAQLQKQLRAEEKKTKDADDKLRQKSRDIKEHAKTLKKLHNKEDALTAENDKLQQKLADSQDAEKQKGADLVAANLEINKHKLLIKSQTTEMAEVDEKFNALVKEQTEGLQSELRKSQAIVTSTQASLRSAEAVNRQQSQKILGLEQPNAQHEKTCEDLREALETIKRGNEQVALMREELGKMSAEKSTLKSELEVARDSFERSEGELWELKAQVAKTSQSLGDSTAAMPAPAASRPMSDQEWAKYLADSAAETDRLKKEGDEIIARMHSSSNSNAANDNMAQNFNIGDSSGNLLPAEASGGDASSEFDFTPYINGDLAPGFELTDQEWEGLINLN